MRYYYKQVTYEQGDATPKPVLLPLVLLMSAVLLIKYYYHYPCWIVLTKDGPPKNKRSPFQCVDTLKEPWGSPGQCLEYQYISAAVLTVEWSP